MGRYTTPFEFVAAAPSYKRHALGVVAVANGEASASPVLLYFRSPYLSSAFLEYLRFFMRALVIPVAVLLSRHEDMFLRPLRAAYCTVLFVVSLESSLLSCYCTAHHCTLLYGAC